MSASRYELIDTHSGSIVVATFPTWLRAYNASCRLETALTMPVAGWRYIIRPIEAEAAPVAIVEPVRVFGAFQTGRLYTIHGQRIAWTVLASGNVAMYDVDRMVDYVLRGPLLTDSAVLRAYDRYESADYASNRDDYAEARALQSALIAAARLVAPIKVVPAQ